MNAHEQANQFITQLRGLEGDAANPTSVRMSINRVQNAQRQAMEAMEVLAQAVREEAAKWGLRNP